MKDIIIVGAGVSGTAIARELSKYKLTIQVLEKDYDIANGTSKANSGIVHPGEDPEPGTLKARMNKRGNLLFDTLSQELKFPFRRNGAMVLCFREKDYAELERLQARGVENGIAPESMCILTRKDALQIEPYLSEEVTHVLYLKTGGIVGPYEMTIALTENAVQNGVTFSLDTEVQAIEKLESGFRVATNQGVYESRIIINAAGVFADEINNQVSEKKYRIIPRKGEYLLLDKKEVAQCTLFQLPTKMGKGVLVTPTCHGNVIVGPSAEDIEDKLDVATTKKKLDEIIEKASQSISKKYLGDVITSFAGIRAHEVGGDFIIKEAEDVKGFINVLGIESPGLTSAPAIAEYVTQLVIAQLKPELNPLYNPIRTVPIAFAEASIEQKQELIRINPKYGNIVCRCERVTEAEIVSAIKAPLGAKTLDGIKRRTRVGMGRCQGGFCMNKIVELLAEHLGISVQEVRKSTEGSELLLDNLKERLEGE